ncbi:MAG: DUF3127 domain-containing protein [Bacteroidota bacterium]|nr:DUF3127 domain-containing protein [Bacteroidota bacterium]
MENKVIGRIFQIGKTEPIQSRDGSKTYYKRELILDATRFDGMTGQRGFDNFPTFEFSGDKCAELDQYKVGEIVTVSFDLQGTKYEKDGQTKFFTRVRGYKVERRQMQQPQAPQQQYDPQPTPQYQQQEQGANDLPF